jgi:hypothetical protein
MVCFCQFCCPRYCWKYCQSWNRVLNFNPGCKTTSPGLKLPTQIQNNIPGLEASYPGAKRARNRPQFLVACIWRILLIIQHQWKWSYILLIQHHWKWSEFLFLIKPIIFFSAKVDQQESVTHPEVAPGVVRFYCCHNFHEPVPTW